MRETVHIIPLGHEIDRAVIPFDKSVPNRIYLLTTFDSKKYSKLMIKKQNYYHKKVHDTLVDKGIEVITKEVDIFDLLQLMRVIATLIREEKSKGNIVEVNISAAGRLTSVGATLASMAQGAEAYYVTARDYSENKKEKDEHGISICVDPEKIQYLKPFRIYLPENAGLVILEKLCEKPFKNMKSNDLIEHLAKKEVEDYQQFKKINSPRFKRYDKQKASIKLNKNVLIKLEKQGYISREKIGREKRIKITKAGIHIAAISGMIQNDIFVENLKEIN